VRTYVGNELPAVADGQLVPGTNTKAEVWRDLRAPERERLRIFAYTRGQEKSDRLVVLFDRSGRRDPF